MLTALILVCSLNVTPDLSDCSRSNAVQVMRLPASFGAPAACFMHGQSYLAESTIGQELGNAERAKVVCAH